MFTALVLVGFFVMALYAAAVTIILAKSAPPRRLKHQLTAHKKIARASRLTGEGVRDWANQNRAKLFAREDRPLKSPTETFENSDRFSVAKKER